MSFRVKIISTFVLLIVSTIIFYENSQAKTLESRNNDILYFSSLNTGGITLFTNVKVELVGTEEYHETGSKRTYVKRETYAWGKKIVDNVGHVSFSVSPLLHYDNKGKKINSFTWTKTNGLYPSCDYMYNKVNSKTVIYEKTNHIIAKQWLWFK